MSIKGGIVSRSSFQDAYNYVFACHLVLQDYCLIAFSWFLKSSFEE